MDFAVVHFWELPMRCFVRLIADRRFFNGDFWWLLEIKAVAVSFSADGAEIGLEPSSVVLDEAELLILLLEET